MRSIGVVINLRKRFRPRQSTSKDRSGPGCPRGPGGPPTHEVKTPLADPAAVICHRFGSASEPGRSRFMVYLYEVKTEAFIRATPSCVGNSYHCMSLSSR